MASFFVTGAGATPQTSIPLGSAPVAQNSAEGKMKLMVRMLSMNALQEDITRTKPEI